MMTTLTCNRRTWSRAACIGRRAIFWLAATSSLALAPVVFGAGDAGPVLHLDAARNDGHGFDPDATTWADLSGHGHAGRFRGAPAPQWAGTGEPGDPRCLRFGGRGGFVAVTPVADARVGGAFTVEALARVRQATLAREEMAPFLARGGMGEAGDFNLQVRVGGAPGTLYLNTQIRDPAGRVLNDGPRFRLADNTFAHFVYTYDPEGTPCSHWYVNGHLMATDARRFAVPATGAPIAIGSHQQGRRHRLDGDIAILRLYDRALSKEQIMQNHDGAARRVPDATGRPEAYGPPAPTLAGVAIDRARVTVTGYDVNRPDPYPGMGDFGWAGNIERLADGRLMLVHQWGYWHSSFAEPRIIEPQTAKRWRAQNWPLDFSAPTGGRSMATYSSDNGLTWTKPVTIADLAMDDSPYGILRCRDGTLLCFMNVQASWYGFDEAPAELAHVLGGLNTQQAVIRSTDGGRTWGEPIWLESPGSFYERSHAQPIELPDGGILWPAYASDGRTARLFGAVHRSDDSGLTWRLLATVRRTDENVDEPAIARLPDGRLIMTSRPDGAVFHSPDDGATWTHTGRIPAQGRFKAPALFVLSDGTVVCAATIGHLCVFLSRDGGATWTSSISVDTSSYGYPGGKRLEDDSILVSYVKSGRAPSRVYLVRFKVNAARTGIDLLPPGEVGAAPGKGPDGAYTEDPDMDAM